MKVRVDYKSNALETKGSCPQCGKPFKRQSEHLFRSAMTLHLKKHGLTVGRYREVT